MKKITNISFKIVQDDHPNLSFLGRHHDGPKNEGIDLFLGKQYAKWFTPGNNWPHNPKNWTHVHHIIKEELIKQHGSLKLTDLYYAKQDMERYKKFLSGSIWMNHYLLKAVIAVSDDGEHWVFDSVNASIGGIESDTDMKYKKEIIDDLKAELRNELTLWKFSQEEIDKAFNKLGEIIVC